LVSRAGLMPRCFDGVFHTIGKAYVPPDASIEHVASLRKCCLRKLRLYHGGSGVLDGLRCLENKCG
jgi:hypothetical protein